MCIYTYLHLHICTYIYIHEHVCLKDAETYLHIDFDDLCISHLYQQSMYLYMVTHAHVYDYMCISICMHVNMYSCIS